MNKTALILTDNQLATTFGKTAHGMILGSSRFDILGVVDKTHAGEDAGFVLNNIKINMPVFASVQEALSKLDQKPDYCVVGAATHGGIMSQSLIEERSFRSKGNYLSIVSET